MTKPIEFNEFYRLLDSVRNGDTKQKKELEWTLAEYEHAKDSSSSFDELGQIFCHIGVMELFDYSGSDDIKYISTLDQKVWDYLQLRMGTGLREYLVEKMISHSNEHELPAKLSKKWDVKIEDLQSNVNDLAKYVSEGIVEVII